MKASHRQRFVTGCASLPLVLPRVGLLLAQGQAKELLQKLALGKAGGAKLALACFSQDTKNFI